MDAEVDKIAIGICRRCHSITVNFGTTEIHGHSHLCPNTFADFACQGTMVAPDKKARYELATTLGFLLTEMGFGKWKGEEE